LPWQPVLGTQFAITGFWLLIGYNFGCMIVGDTLFYSRGGFFGVKLSDEVIADFEVLRDIAMANIFWLSMGYNFGCMITSATLFGSLGEFSR